MNISKILKSRKTHIISGVIVAILCIGALMYKAELKRLEAEQKILVTPPSDEEIARMSQEAWERYKKEQAEQAAQGIVNQMDNMPDQSAVIRDYFLEALRETLHVGADKSAFIQLMEMDDPCLKLNEAASTNNVIVYECVHSARYPQGTIRRVILDDNGKIIDYFIDSNPGIHSGNPYVPSVQEQQIEQVPQ